MEVYIYLHNVRYFSVCSRMHQYLYSEFGTVKVEWMGSQLVL